MRVIHVIAEPAPLRRKLQPLLSLSRHRTPTHLRWAKTIKNRQNFSLAPHLPVWQPAAAMKNEFSRRALLVCLFLGVQLGCGVPAGMELAGAATLLQDSFNLTAANPDTTDVNFQLAQRQSGALAVVTYTKGMASTFSQVGNANSPGELLLAGSAGGPGGAVSLDHDFVEAFGSGVSGVIEFDVNPVQIYPGFNETETAWVAVTFGSSAGSRNQFPQYVDGAGLLFRGNGQYQAFNAGQELGAGAYLARVDHLFHHVRITLTETVQGNPCSVASPAIVAAFADGSAVPFFSFLNTNGFTHNYISLIGEGEGSGGDGVVRHLIDNLAISVEPSAASSGGRIIGACLTNSQMQLSFDTTSGCSYQVQSCPVVPSRFWVDALPLISATGNLASAQVPAPTPAGFFKVLEFSSPVFWYDWGYYYQAPFLCAWGLGSTQSIYAHLDRSYEWYIDQADTGPCADNNCGPSSVTMGIKWFTQNFTQTAEDARNTYPEGGGWWYTSDVINYLNLYSAPNTTSSFTGTDQLMGLLNQGNLVVLCLTTAYLTPDDTDAHREGRFYSYSGGHFLVVKGWRSTNSGLFFEVYDPNNWHAAYADLTPKGRNRHYAAGDLASAIANWWNYLIVVHPPGGGGSGAKQSAWLRPVDPAQIPDMWGK